MLLLRAFATICHKPNPSTTGGKQTLLSDDGLAEMDGSGESINFVMAELKTHGDPDRPGKLRREEGSGKGEEDQ